MPITPIYTIGYGQRNVAELLAVLQANQIQYVLDVRSSPYSSYKPEFSKNDLQNFLEANGAEYAFANHKRLVARLESLGITYLHCRDLAPPPEIRERQKQGDKASKVAKRQRSRPFSSISQKPITPGSFCG